MGLYQISTVVDIINLISLSSGYSIGGYDFDSINGSITLGMGKADDVYEAIGRGKMNIENLPVFSDDEGPFGSPTSDSERTMITMNTKKILLIFLNFGGQEDMNDWLKQTKSLLENYAGGKNIVFNTVST